MTVIHIQDKNFPGQPLHFESRTKHLRFADENNPATCKICLAMVKRAAKYQARKEVISCPKCGSTNIHADNQDKFYYCRDCDHTWDFNLVL